MTLFLKDINYSALRRGYDEFLVEGDQEAFAWPKCEKDRNKLKLNWMD